MHNKKGPNELRLKTMRLIGRQNLQEYKFWKGGAEEIAKEYEWNKSIGLKLGCWKSGVLVYDDSGKVADLIAERSLDAQRTLSSEVRFLVLVRLSHVWHLINKLLL